MTESTVVAQEPLPGLFARAIGVITSPRATFEKVVRNPKGVGILFVVALLAGVSQSAFQLTERGQQAQTEFNVKQMERFGVNVTDQMYDQMQARAKFGAYTSFIGTFLVLPVVVLIVSAIMYAIFNAIMGGTAEFKQVLAVMAHSWVIPGLGAIFVGIMNFVRGSISTSAANLGQLLPMLPEGSFAANIAGAVDVFTIWWILVMAMGLAVLYKRKTANIATGLFIVYGLFAISVAFFFAKKG